MPALPEVAQRVKKGFSEIRNVFEARYKTVIRLLPR